MKITRKEYDLLRPIYIALKETLVTYSFMTDSMNKTFLFEYHPNYETIVIDDDVNYGKFLDYIKVATVARYEYETKQSLRFEKNRIESEIDKAQKELNKQKTLINERRKEIDFLTSIIKKIKFFKDKKK